MPAPIIWTPGKMPRLCRKNHVHKIPRFRGGILDFGGGRGGSADLIFMGASLRTKERKHKFAKERKRAQKSAKERFRVTIANNQV